MTSPFGPPIAFRPEFVPLAGSANAALFLSQCWYWSEVHAARDGWFYKTMKEWQTETGLTRRQQEAARESLLQKGFLEERRGGEEAGTRMHFRVCRERILTAVSKCTERTNQNVQNVQYEPVKMYKTYKSKCTERTNQNVQNVQIPYIESTTSTTTSTTIPPGANAPGPTGGAAGSRQRPRDRPPPESSALWEAYSKAYCRRYGIEPKRNARVNGQLAQLVQRLGLSDACAVAVFYLAHNGRYYAQQAHSVGPLLRDAESLFTQWRTGHRVTETQAREDDRLQKTGDMWRQISEEIDAKSRGQPPH